MCLALYDTAGEMLSLSVQNVSIYDLEQLTSFEIALLPFKHAALPNKRGYIEDIVKVICVGQHLGCFKNVVLGAKF